MDSPPPTFISVDLTSSYGAMLIGSYVSCAIWGISTLQTYLYYWTYDQDALSLKLLVAFLWCMDTVHQVFVLKTTWHTLIQQFGNIANLSVLPQEALHNVWTEYVVVGLVQIYYMRRIVNFASTTRYGRKWWIWPIYMLLVAVFLGQYAAMIGFLVSTFNKSMAAVFEPHTVHFATSLLVTSAVVDIAIGVGMLLLLRTSASRFTATSSMLSRLSFIVVNTGLLTAAFAIFTLALDVSYGSADLWYTLGQFPACSVYFSGFLANLNSRQYVRGEGGIKTFSNIEDLHSHTSGVVNGSSTGASTVTYFGRRNKENSFNSTASGNTMEHPNDALVVNVHKYRHAMADDGMELKRIDPDVESA